MQKLIITIASVALLGCADPAFNQYIQTRQAAIASMPNEAAKWQAQQTLDAQIYAEKRRQEAQAAQATAAIGAGMMAGAAAYNASRPYYYPYPQPTTVIIQQRTGWGFPAYNTGY
jgi:hypothetical protein